MDVEVIVVLCCWICSQVHVRECVVLSKIALVRVEKMSGLVQWCTWGSLVRCCCMGFHASLRMCTSQWDSWSRQICGWGGLLLRWFSSCNCSHVSLRMRTSQWNSWSRQICGWGGLILRWFSSCNCSHVSLRMRTSQWDGWSRQICGWGGLVLRWFSSEVV